MSRVLTRLGCSPCWTSASPRAPVGVTRPPSCTPLMPQAARVRRVAHGRTCVAAIDPPEAHRPFRVRSAPNAAVPNPSESSRPSSAAPKGAVRRAAPCRMPCGAVLQSVRPTQPTAGPSLHALVRTRFTLALRLRTARVIPPWAVARPEAQRSALDGRRIAETQARRRLPWVLRGT